MTSAAEYLFWCALVFVVYTYAGYPLLVWVLSHGRHIDDVHEPSCWPAVTFVIAVHNERERALQKVTNLRELDYPADLVEIVFACDGCTDGTDVELAKLPGIGVVSYQPRQGKPHALNRALLTVTTPVVVFADVRQRIHRQALRALVARLSMPQIGAVSGELVHHDPVSNTAANIGLYWRYEKWIRACESRLGSTVGVTGALYAIRRSDFTPLPSDTLLDDFVQPMSIARKGKRVVLESRALVYDQLQEDISGERTRKVRTLTGNFQAFIRHPWLFVPWVNPIWFQFVSHKVFRLMVPYALLLLLVASVAAIGWIYKIALVVQGVLYTAAFIGARSVSARKLRLVSFAMVFVELNWAAVLGLSNYLRGQVDARWERT